MPSTGNRFTLEAMLANRKQKRAADLLVRRPVQGGSLPLSFGQQRLWFLDQLIPGSSEHVISLGWRLHGELNVDALVSAFSGLVARHEVLRTRFVLGDNFETVQVLEEPWRVGIRVVDLSSVDDAVREARVHDVMDEESLAPFDLRSGRVLRVRLIRVAEFEHVLLACIHHIAADGWSVGVINNELSELYAGAVEGRAPVLPKLAVQYGDFAVWQRERLSGALLDQQLGYWRGRLEGLKPLELPADHPRPPQGTTRGDTVSFNIPEASVVALRALAARKRASLFMVMLAAFQAALSRWSGQFDVSTGIAVAGRTRTEFEGIVGFFVNTLVIRTDTAGNPSFDELLNRVKGSTLDAFDHQDLPFERLVEELAPERDISRNPLIQTIFAFHNLPDRQGGSWPRLFVEEFGIPMHAATFDMTINVNGQSDGSLACNLVYASELFDRATMERMSGYLRNLIAKAVEDPESPVA